MTKVTAKKLTLSIVVALGALMLNGNKVYADHCEIVYGGGEICDTRKTFDVQKKVRIKGETDYSDKVINVGAGDTIQFRIRIKNTGNVEVDNMKMKDILPDELYKLATGDGLIEEWDNFEPGETKEFIIEAKINADEFDIKNLDKCVVNRVDVTRGDKFVDSDTATVCYNTVVLRELPKTGADSTIAFALVGFVLVGFGIAIKNYRYA